MIEPTNFIKDFKRKAAACENAQDIKNLCWTTLYAIAHDYDRSGYIAKQLLDVIDELIGTE